METVYFHCFIGLEARFSLIGLSEVNKNVALKKRDEK